MSWRNSNLDWLLAEFRLLLNKSIRIAIQGGIESRLRLHRAAYPILSRDHSIHTKYIHGVFEVALSLL